MSTFRYRSAVEPAETARMGRTTPARWRRILGATSLVLGTLAVSVATTAAPAAADGDEPDGYASFVFAQYNGGSDSGTGTYGALPECGPININGRDDFAKWSVGTSVADDATIEVGDVVELKATVFSRPVDGAVLNGNNGPDPLRLNLPTIGPAELASPTTGSFPAGGYAHSGDESTGPVGPYGLVGFEFDTNSDPSVIWPGDGAYVDMTVRIRATAPGAIQIPNFEVSGYDGTGNGSNFLCVLPVNLNWTVDDVDLPTSAPDTATTDSSYGAPGDTGTVDDANGGAHAIDIDVLSNDNDPEVAGGPGDTDEVRIYDWATASAHGGTIDCASPGSVKAGTDFDGLSVGPCRYTPPQETIGPDNFKYTIESVSGTRRTVTVNVTLKPNPAPFVSVAEFASADDEVDLDIDLNDAISDFAGDTSFFCIQDFAVQFTPDVGDGEIGTDCHLTFDAANVGQQTVGSFTYRVCDEHDLLTSFGSLAVAAPGYDQGSPDDLTATTSSRCRDAQASVRVVPAAEQLVAAPVGVPDFDVVDAGYADSGGIGDFTLRMPVVDNDYDITDPEFPDEIGGFDMLPGSLDPAQGTATFEIDEATDTYELLFTPAQGVEGEVSFQYRICDDPDVQNPPLVDPDPNDQVPLFGLCGLGTVTIFVVPNDPPIAEDDEVLTSSIDPVVDFEAGVNDSDPQGDTLQCVAEPLAADPALVASASIDAGCLVDITPVLGASGVADIPYTVCDVHALAHPSDPETPYGEDGEAPGDVVSRCSTAVVAATIVEPLADDPGLLELDPDPVCVADTATTTAGTAIQIAVLTNDSDRDVAQAVSPLVVTNAGSNGVDDLSAQGGAVAATANGGAVSYTPPPSGFTGTDTFTYGAQDSIGQGCSATVTVTVTAVAASELPRTGDGMGWQLALAIGFALMGAGFVLWGELLRPRPA